WRARCDSGVITVRPEKASAVEALLWPIRLRAEGSAQEVASAFVTWAHARDPKLEAWVVPTQEANPTQVLLRTQSSAGAGRIEGVVTVTVSGTSALISGFSGPTESSRGGAIEEADTLAAITSSLRVEIPVPRQRFREPADGSFEAVVPIGWIAKGRT